MNWQELLPLIQAGGNAALLVSVYFMLKITDRLARIDTRLEVLLAQQKLFDPVKEGHR